jgi:succinate dehydrogenase/fumarate reductase flavoprotein subunit
MPTETTYDVVVCGCGGSGAAAAIEAHDAGASVVVLEKAAAAGGSTRESGGSVATLVDPAGAVEHYLALTEGLTPRPVMQAYVDGVVELHGWIERNGGHTTSMQMRMPAFPHRYAGSAYGDRPFAEAIGTRVRFQEPGVTHGGSALWRFLERNLERRGIPVLFDAPVLRLCRSGVSIAGVEARIEGQPVTYTARRGVVLATGGFGANGPMVKDMVGAELPPLAPAGRNTGDGLRMAQAAGADLWHMNCVAAGFGYLVPGHSSAFMACMSAYGFFLVDGSGHRYLDELSIEHHAAAQAMLVRDYRTGGLPRLPSYLIFDERTRLAGRISSDEAGANREVSWADDNSDAIERGWIKRAGSIGALAAELGLPASELESTAREYIAAAASGKDAFGRAAEGMAPVSEPPFYGIAVWPALFNTQGGPRRNQAAQVLDTEGRPISRLFSAGELGSIWAALYPGAGNVTEAVVFGRIAGRNAAIHLEIQAHNRQEY